MTRCIINLAVLRDYFAHRLNTADLCPSSPESTLVRDSDDDETTATATLLAFRECCLRAESEHRPLFDSYLDKMVLLGKEDTAEEESRAHLGRRSRSLLKGVRELAERVFEDGRVNWGRICIVCSFGAYVAFRYACGKAGGEAERASRLACKLLEWLALFVTCRLGIWIECNGGWVSPY